MERGVQSVPACSASTLGNEKSDQKRASELVASLCGRRVRITRIKKGGCCFINVSTQKCFSIVRTKQSQVLFQGYSLGDFASKENAKGQPEKQKKEKERMHRTLRALPWHRHSSPVAEQL